jgi:hypothetical protein
VDACGEPAVSVDLKVLAALRILARGNDADTINELTGVSHSTIMKYFHAFNRSAFFSTYPIPPSMSPFIYFFR